MPQVNELSWSFIFCFLLLVLILFQLKVFFITLKKVSNNCMMGLNFFSLF